MSEPNTFNAEFDQPRAGSRSKRSREWESKPIEVQVNDLGRAGLATPLAWILGAICLVAYGPSLYSYFSTLWNLPHYQFFPLVLAGAIPLAVKQIQDMRTLEPGGMGPTLLGALICVTLLAGSALLDSGWLGAVSAWVFLLTLSWTVGGRQLVWRLIPVFLFLLLIIRIPLGLDLRLINELQLVTSKLSSRMLDVIHVHHLREGVVLELSPKRLLVAEACSGIHSLFSSLACALFFLVWFRRGWIRWILVLGSTVCWVLLANVTRVTLIAWLLDRYGIEADSGILHYGIDIVLFAMILGLIASTDSFLEFFTTRVLGRPSDFEWTPPSLQAMLHQPLRLAQPVAFLLLAGFAVVGLGNWALAVADSRAQVQAKERETSEAGKELGEDFLPAEFDGWQRVKYERERRNTTSILGEHSQIWKYRKGRLQAVVSIDYPFQAWHDLVICYTNTGWEVNRRQSVAGSERQGDDPPHTHLKMSKANGDLFGDVFFGAFDEQKRAVTPSFYTTTEKLWDRLSFLPGLRGLRSKPNAGPGGRASQVFQVQVLVQSQLQMTEPERESAKKLFLTSYRKLRESWQPPGGSAQ